ncbi:MAG: HAD family phosphatase [Bacteroidaceae bacterium]|nr:HAD family phosphatase [Bacteroidaceae bacterium]
MKFDKKILIFDLGGVVLDIHVERAFGALRALGVSTALLTERESLMNSMIQDFDCGRVSAFEFYNYIVSLLPPRIREIPTEELHERIHEIWNMILGTYDVRKLRRISELREKGFRVVLLSNTNEGHWNEIERKLYFTAGVHIEDCFDALYLSYKMNMRKPDPAIFLELLRCEQAAAADCLFFDDSLENCEAARSVGIDALLVERNSQWGDELMKD